MAPLNSSISSICTNFWRHWVPKFDCIRVETKFLIIGPRRNFKLCPLVCFDAGVNFVGGMATSPVLIPWIKMTRLFFLRSSSRSHFKLSNIDDTLSVLLYLFVMYLVALLCAFLLRQLFFGFIWWLTERFETKRNSFDTTFTLFFRLFLV